MASMRGGKSHKRSQFLGIALLVLIYIYVVAEFTAARTKDVRRGLLQPLASAQRREVV
jgi:hypothetical protein